MKAMAVYCISGYLRHTQRDPALTLTITQRSLSIEETPGLIQSQFPIQTGDLHSSPCGDSTSRPEDQLLSHDQLLPGIQGWEPFHMSHCPLTATQYSCIHPLSYVALTPVCKSQQQALPSRRYHMQPQMSTYACVSVCVCVSLHTCLYKYLHMFV